MDSIIDKLIHLGKIEGKHESGEYYETLMNLKEMFSVFKIDLDVLLETINYRNKLYKDLHLIRNDDEKLKKFMGTVQKGGSKQIGGSLSLFDQLNQQLNESKNELKRIELQEDELRKLRGGFRKKRQFTRKQRGGRLSSTLKQGISRNYYHSQYTASQDTASQYRKSNPYLSKISKITTT